MKKSIQTPLGVYTDDEVGIEMIESYANQRVVEELHNLYNEEEEHNDCISKELIYRRLKELKKD